jgi:ubiquinone/menaquinone biosynthesis C-methylase UbiE
MRSDDPDRAVIDNRRIIDFFDADYSWWREVYSPTLPRRFFSFEMIKRRELVVEMVNKYAVAGDRPHILECGCGPGGILKEFVEQRWRLTGIDINPRHLALARSELGKSVDWFQADVENLPFRNQAFDIVCCVGVLSYLQEDEAAVTEISRIVKPGGVVIMALPNWLMLNKIFDPYYYLVWMPLRALRKLTAAPEVATRRRQRFSAEMIRRYKPARINEMFRRHGLVEVESSNVSFGPLTFWRREFLPLRLSMQLSEALLSMGKRKGFPFLRGITNHWISCLEKTGS